jgi:subtilisin family serine protease
MKHYFQKFLLQKGIVGVAIVSSLFATYSCTKDFTEDVTQQSVSLSSDATALAGKNGDIIPGKYIVVLKEEEASQQINSGASYEEATRRARAFGQQILRSNGLGTVQIEYAYGSSIKGFSALMNPREANLLLADSRVAYIEPDRIITLSQKGKKPSGDSGGETVTSTQAIPWGITAVGGIGTGSNKVAWVLDTGIDLTHPDLTVDVANGYTVFKTGRDSNDANDGNGHGTHVAGTIAALNNTIGVVGVAAGASVVPVKVLNSNGSGSYSGVIEGVNYVAAKANAGDVANMSLGGPKSNALNGAVETAAAKGILFAIAAGNDGKPAIDYSPASADHVNIFTITAYGENLSAPSWSNFGKPPVDFSAPGVSINSTWRGGGYRTISGTSMAAPHMAGILLIKGTNFINKGSVNGDSGGAKYGLRAAHK